MKFSQVLTLLLGSAARLFSGLVAAEPGTYMDVTPSNLDATLDGSRHVLLALTAPWCGHCKSLKPVYAELAHAFAHASDSLVIANVDADAHKDIGAKFDVKGFPTLKWFPKGSKVPEDYTGGRDLDALSAFVTQKTGIQSKIVKPLTFVKEISDSEFDAVVKAPGVNALVEAYAPWCGHCKTLKPIYEKVAAAFANEPTCLVTAFDATKNEGLAKRLDVSGYPTLKFFATGAKEAETYEGGRTETDLVSFLNKRCGTQRLPGGDLSAEGGLIPELDTIVEEFTTASDKKKVVEKLKKEAKAAKDKAHANYYVKVAEKVLDKAGFAQKEFDRLTRILTGALSIEKRDGVMLRKNVLGKFLGKAQEKKVSEETVKEEL